MIIPIQTHVFGRGQLCGGNVNSSVKRSGHVGKYLGLSCQGIDGNEVCGVRRSCDRRIGEGVLGWRGLEWR